MRDATDRLLWSSQVVVIPSGIRKKWHDLPLRGHGDGFIVMIDGAVRPLEWRLLVDTNDKERNRIARSIRFVRTDHL